LFIFVPVQSSETAEADLNAFLTSHKVLTVDRRWVDLGGGWSCRRVALVNTQCILDDISEPFKNTHNLLSAN